MYKWIDIKDPKSELQVYDLIRRKSNINHVGEVLFFGNTYMFVRWDDGDEDVYSYDTVFQFQRQVEYERWIAPYSIDRESDLDYEKSCLYWRVSMDGDVYETSHDDTKHDDGCFRFGNYFRLEKHAKEASSRIAKLLSDYHEELGE